MTPEPVRLHEPAKGLPLIVRVLVLLLGVALLVGIPIAVSARMIAGSAIEDATLARLTAARAIKASRIESYLTQIEAELDVIARLPETATAIRTMSAAFAEVEPTEAGSRATRTFIEDVFAPGFAAATGGSIAADAILPDDPRALELQSLYIAGNPNPIGRKDELVAAERGLAYDEAHADVHPIMRALQRRFGYYDIFLIDESGTIVYTVFKEIDFATNLLDGPFRDSGLADAVRAVLDDRASDALAFSDFSMYRPSNDAPAAFLAAAVSSGGRRIGSVAVQLSIDEIDETMTGGGMWIEEGFGRTGETFLVGPDGMMRSDARGLIESPESYLRRSTAAGVSREAVDGMRRTGHSVLLQRVDDDAVRAALAGETGDRIVTGRDGRALLASYQPVDVFGQRWAVVSRIERDEAFAAADELRATILAIGGGVLLLVLIISVVAGRQIVAPIGRLHDAMSGLESGDYDVRVAPGGGRELTALAVAFNRVAATLGLKARMEAANDRKDALIDDIAALTATQASGAIQIAGAVTEISAGSREIAKTAEELTLTMTEVDGIASETSGRGAQGLDSIRRVETAMGGVVADAEQVSDHLGEIERRCEAMGQVVDTMVSIADRTQILSINATMEAEKAGDAGLGFRVVAREVRRLADRTAESAGRIEENVGRMLASVEEGVRRMDDFRSRLDDAASLTGRVADDLSGVIERTQELGPRFATVLESMKAQRDAARQISEAMAELNDNVGSTRDAVKTVDTSIADLRELSERIRIEIAEESVRLGL